MDKLTELSDVESGTLNILAKVIIDTRLERNERVWAAREAYDAADDITRLVADVCIGHYMRTTDPESVLIKPDFFRPKAFFHAPGLYTVPSEILRSEVINTGEFISSRSLTNVAKTIGFIAEHGWSATEFLYQWIAAQHPESRAAEVAQKFGLRSGRMSHNINGKGNFNTRAVIIHKSHAEDYIDLVKAEVLPPHTILDPIICLDATDNWEEAVSLMSPQKQRQMNPACNTKDSLNPLER